jgi:hypothetical protein
MGVKFGLSPYGKSITEGVWEEGAKNIFEPKRDEGIGVLRKVYNEELHNLYSSSDFIRMTKSKSRRCEVHVARLPNTGRKTWKKETTRITWT